LGDRIRNIHIRMFFSSLHNLGLSKKTVIMARKFVTTLLIVMIVFGNYPLGYFPIPVAHAADTVIVIDATYTDACGTNCWTVPADWNDAANTIEVIGPGGNGAAGASNAASGGGGGGGGGHASTTNLILISVTTVGFQLGTPGASLAASSTWFSSQTTVRAGGGANAVAGTASKGGQGGVVYAGTGFVGGTGGNGGTLSTGGSGAGGGGGAAGPNGAGRLGGNGFTSTNGVIAGGGGGGGNGGGTDGTTATDGNGAVGGNGNIGSGGGATPSANGTVDSGGGGAGATGISAIGAATIGGHGATSTDEAAGANGTGGGGGGGGGNAATASTGNNGGPGGHGAAGGGGGGGGSCNDTGCTVGAGGSGGKGFIVITYTPIIPIKISGRIYSDEGTTQLASAGKTLTVRMGTSTAGFFATSTVAANGFWQIPNILNTGMFIGMPIHAWVDGDSTFRAFTFTKASSTAGNITGLDLYKDYVIVKHEGFSGTSTINQILPL
jgi:hypothetical protein